jgi:hypothetical protein
MPKLSDLVSNTLPNGIYQIRLEDFESAPSQAGNAQIKIEGVIVDGEFKGDGVVFWRSLTSKALFMLAQDLLALGAEDVEFEAGDTDAALELLEPFKDRVFNVKVTQGKPFNGRKKNEFAIVGEANDNV